ncbi:hypothetical protein NBT05_17335 [Aquimarina sp. ERC-38]|uniref:toxin-antitoxin system YwqK family antitoxin n=1 Tax=Aquimarina sp. ERC-38 TaxID=2949996 RepID=UPI0022467306|nr:hypothetical protein [Aquimarina sp. ERC-38]UZO80692.1 hypothetical protein NBT05_17335 [Aquimarina sp. ERC-38]
MKLLCSLLLIFCNFSQTLNEVERKIISDDYYNYTFFVNKKISKKYSFEKKYFWYKSGGVHSSLGGANGYLLEGKYTKYFRKNGIAEQGNFEKGLKHKKWKTWYENGILKEIKTWDQGIASGPFLSFNENGSPVLSGRYKHNAKSGKWINHIEKDTLYYKKGKIVVKPKDTISKSKTKKISKSKITKFWNSSNNTVKEFFRKKTPAEKKAIKNKRAKQKKLNDQKVKQRKHNKQSKKKPVKNKTDN